MGMLRGELSILHLMGKEGRGSFYPKPGIRSTWMGSPYTDKHEESLDISRLVGEGREDKYCLLV